MWGKRWPPCDTACWMDASREMLSCGYVVPSDSSLELRPRQLRQGVPRWPQGAVHLINAPGEDLAPISRTNAGTLPDKRPLVTSHCDSSTLAMCSAYLDPRVRVHTCRGDREREREREKELSSWKTERQRLHCPPHHLHFFFFKKVGSKEQPPSAMSQVAININGTKAIQWPLHNQFSFSENFAPLHVPDKTVVSHQSAAS